MITVKCPYCQAAIRCDDSYAGRAVLCPTCKKQLQMPRVAKPLPAQRPPSALPEAEPAPDDKDDLSFLSGGSSPASSPSYSKPRSYIPKKKNKKKTDPTLFIVGGIVALVAVIGIGLFVSGSIPGISNTSEPQAVLSKALDEWIAGKKAISVASFCDFDQAFPFRTPVKYEIETCQPSDQAGQARVAVLIHFTHPNPNWCQERKVYIVNQRNGKWKIRSKSDDLKSPATKMKFDEWNKLIFLASSKGPAQAKAEAAEAEMPMVTQGYGTHDDVRRLTREIGEGATERETQYSALLEAKKHELEARLKAEDDPEIREELKFWTTVVSPDEANRKPSASREPEQPGKNAASAATQRTATVPELIAQLRYPGLRLQAATALGQIGPNAHRGSSDPLCHTQGRSVRCHSLTNGVDRD